MSQPSAKNHWATSHPYRSTSRTSQCCQLPELSPRSVAVAPAPPGWIQSGASRPQTRIRWDVPRKVKVSPSATLLTVASSASRTSAWTWVKTSRRARERMRKNAASWSGHVSPWYDSAQKLHRNPATIFVKKSKLHQNGSGGARHPTSVSSASGEQKSGMLSKLTAPSSNPRRIGRGLEIGTKRTTGTPLLVTTTSSPRSATLRTRNNRDIDPDKGRWSRRWRAQGNLRLRRLHARECLGPM